MPEITKKEPTKIKKIEPITNIINFIEQMKFKPLPLPKNHRSVQPIVDLCTILVRGIPIIGRETTGLNHCVILDQ